MNREAFDKAIAETPKGANIVLEWRRDAATYKTFDGVVEKETRMVGRIGLDYDNIGEVQADNTVLFRDDIDTGKRRIA